MSRCNIENTDSSTEIGLKYPIYFSTDWNVFTTAKEVFNITIDEEKIVDIELSSSSDDDEVSLNDYDVVFAGEYVSEDELNELENPKKSNDADVSSTKPSTDLDSVIAKWIPCLVCPLCGGICLTFTQLEEHFSTQHPGTFCHVICCNGMMFYARFPLIEHIGIHHSQDVGSQQSSGTTSIELPKNEVCSSYSPKDLTSEFSENEDVSEVDIADIAPDDTVPRRRIRKSPQQMDELIAKHVQFLECGICKTHCLNYEMLKTHFHSKHSSEEVHSICCGFKLIQRCNILMHIRKYHADDDEDRKSKKVTNFSKSLREMEAFIQHYAPRLKCWVCSKECTGFSRLKNHFCQFHPDAEGYLLCCQRSFKQTNLFLEHMLVHLNPNYFHCKHCNKNFISRLTLVLHMAKIHSDADERHSIKELSKDQSDIRIEFRAIDAFIARWWPHLECVICQKSYQTFKHLENHFSREHRHEKCHITCCETKFYDRHKIEEHIMLHIDTRGFRCHACNKYFKSRPCLFYHSYMEHPFPSFKNGDRIRKSRTELDIFISKRIPKLDCAICQKSFPSFSSLKLHFTSKHPKKHFSIWCCNLKFFWRSRFLKHIKTHDNHHLPNENAKGQSTNAISEISDTGSM